MGLVINHNLMASNAARNLSTIYGRLSTSTQRLSSGLRINSAADDAAGLAIREMMRADIAVLNQGSRNAADAISMIQTAEGALSVIDEKLIRMKELAEQASTGTYTTAQREIMNSEYQAMAAEIDRIANATDFNGIKLLDGTVAQSHQGQGLKVHFGTGNESTEDYYFVSMGDARATEKTGLQVGGDAENDIWGQGGISENGEVVGCCGIADLDSLTDAIDGASGAAFAYAYNYDKNTTFNSDGTNTNDENLVDHPSYLAGMYTMESGDSLQDLVNDVNQGTQSRIKIDFAANTSAGVWGMGGNSGAVNICLGDEIYQYYDGAMASGANSANINVLSTSLTAASALASGINGNADSDFWAVVSAGDVYVFAKNGGDLDYLEGCDQGLGTSGVSAANAYVNWQNMETYEEYSAGTTFGNGGEKWGTMTASENKVDQWGVSLSGRDVGDNADLRIVDIGSGVSILDTGSGGTFASSSVTQLTGFAARDFAELQDAKDAEWRGAEIRTQSSAQESLDAIAAAIEKKDKIRADLGALQNRLENTMTNIGIQAENLQASESRISDVDVATEMTEFTRNNIMAQAATSMLAQANSLAQLALSLMG